jgi:hypothetical protein
MMVTEYRTLRENLVLNNVKELGVLLFVLCDKYRTLRENLSTNTVTCLSV